MSSNSAPAPDYTALASASDHAADVMKNLGQQQINLAKQQYADNKPILQGIANSQQKIMGNEADMGAAENQLQKDSIIPLEKSVVDQANNFNTTDYQEQQARNAAANYGAAASNNQAALARQMAAMGVNPNSGQFKALANQNAITNAAGEANAMTEARNNAVQMGFANKLAAAGLGTGNSGAANGAYSVANGAGNSASENTLAPGNALLNGMNAGTNTIGSGLGMQLNGLGNILNSQSNLYGEAMNNTSGMFGSAAGLAGSLGAAAILA